jgi:L-ascorbate metabolism protein UlaG (beta-lactamase superfamily)
MQAKHLQRLGTASMLLVLLASFGACLFYLNWQPRLDEDRHAWVPRSTLSTSAGLTLRWLGAAGVYLTDGDTTLLVDPFFTRPTLTRLVLGKLRPEPTRIRSALKRAGVDDVDAVIVTHAHFDHALDAPWIADHFDARFLGSPSAANLARGQGLSEALIREVDDRAHLRVGAFRLRFPPSRHVPLPPLLAPLSGANHRIERPLPVPAGISHFRQGRQRSLHVTHPQGRVLIHGSAGVEPGALKDLQANLVLTSVARLSQQSQDYQQDFVQHGVKTLKPDWVVPMDWDDFTRPVGKTVPPPSLLLGNAPGSLRSLDRALEPTASRLQLTRPLWRLRLVRSGDGVELTRDASR